MGNESGEVGKGWLEAGPAVMEETVLVPLSVYALRSYLRTGRKEEKGGTYVELLTRFRVLLLIRVLARYVNC